MEGTTAGLGSTSELMLSLPSLVSSQSSRPEQGTAGLSGLREPL